MCVCIRRFFPFRVLSRAFRLIIMASSLSDICPGRIRRWNPTPPPHHHPLSFFFFRKERPVFGKIRFMNYAGCKRKFKVDQFVARYRGASENAARVSSSGAKKGGGGIEKFLGKKRKA